MFGRLLRNNAIGSRDPGARSNHVTFRCTWGAKIPVYSEGDMDDPTRSVIAVLADPLKHDGSFLAHRSVHALARSSEASNANIPPASKSRWRGNGQSLRMKKSTIKTVGGPTEFYQTPYALLKSDPCPSCRGDLGWRTIIVSAGTTIRD